MCLIAHTPPKSHTSSEQFFKAVWGAVSWVVVLIKTLNNLSLPVLCCIWILVKLKNKTKHRWELAWKLGQGSYFSALLLFAVCAWVVSSPLLGVRVRFCKMQWRWKELQWWQPLPACITRLRKATLSAGWLAVSHAQLFTLEEDVAGGSHIALYSRAQARGRHAHPGCIRGWRQNWVMVKSWGSQSNMVSSLSSVSF